MSTHLLPIYIKNAEYNISKTITAFVSRKITFQEALVFSSHFRICAIGWLLLAYDVQKFSKFLHMAASSFRFYIEDAPTEAQVISHSDPFFDAVATGDGACAAAIARHSRPTWNPDYEYEDDFLHMRSMMKLVVPDEIAEDLSALLTRWEALLAGGQKDEKLNICKALHASDSEGFNQSFIQYLSDMKERNDRLARADRILPELAATNGRISIEGIALLRIAEARGLVVEDEYLMIPSAIRDLRVADADPNDWRTG